MVKGDDVIAADEAERRGGVRAGSPHLPPLSEEKKVKKKEKKENRWWRATDATAADEAERREGVGSLSLIGGRLSPSAAIVRREESKKKKQIDVRKKGEEKRKVGLTFSIMAPHISLFFF